MTERMEVVTYLHGSKEQCWGLGEKIGLSEEALKYFKHALTEFEVVLSVDMETGESEPVKFNGKLLVDEQTLADKEKHIAILQAQIQEWMK